MGEVGNTWSESGSDIVCLEGNGCRPSHQGDGWRVGGAMYTLNATEVHCVAYSIHSYNSEGALKSKTPYAHVTDKSRTVDLLIANPDCNQGGLAVVEIHTVGESSGRQQSENS